MSFLHALYKNDVLKAPQVVLLRLLTADYSGATPNDIADSTGLAKSTVSMAVDALEGQKLVERRFQARDKRSAIVYLTAKGRTKTKKLLAAMTAYVDDVKKREGRVRP